MIVTHNFLEDMAVVLCVAGLATVICQLLRQPLLLGYLVAGMVVGPSVPGLYASTERVHLVSELGVTVLVFAIGLEFDLRRLIRLAPTAGVVALIQFAAMVGLGYLVGHVMGWTPWESLLTGAILSISGIVIIAKVFEETRVDPRVRELVFGVVLCEDVIAILGGLGRKRDAQLPLHVSSGGRCLNCLPVPIADSGVHAGGRLARSPPSPAGSEYAFSI
jgi:monovalent cation:H+ antiporter-2, CPA2 family